MKPKTIETEIRKSGSQDDSCGGLEMAPHANKVSPEHGAHKSQVIVIVTTSDLS